MLAIEPGPPASSLLSIGRTNVRNREDLTLAAGKQCKLVGVLSQLRITAGRSELLASKQLLKC